MTTIAVTGATGRLGSRVARMLSERGIAQRLVVRDPARAPRLDGAEVAAASYEDGAALRTALDGVGTLLLVSAPEGPHRMSVHRSAVGAARAAGVDRIVYTSFMGASPLATFTYARDHSLTEQEIVAGGMRLTALRSALYADEVPGLVQDGVIRGPAGRGRVAWVARHDIARLAVETLLDAAHADRVYDVSGPEALDLHETAEVLSDVTGRAIAYVPETDEEARASRAGAAEWEIAGWTGSYKGIATGEISVTSHTVELVTGRRPWTLAELLRHEPTTWEHLLA